MFSFDIKSETKLALTAIAYHTGAKGKASAVVRNMLCKGIDRYMGGLDEEDRKQYESILIGVRGGIEPRPDTLMSVYGLEDLRLILVSIAWMQEAGGAYAVPVRQFISQGIRDYVAGLDSKKRREYEEILETVKIRESMK